MRQGTRLIALFATTLLSACSLHLHNASDAKRARGALDGFEQLKVDSVVATSRTNFAALSKAELETRQHASDVLMRRDLVSVIGPEARAPRTDGEEGAPLGWPKVALETRAALKPYALLARGQFADPGKKSAIRDRAANERDLATETRTYLSFVADYKRGANPGTQDTECAKVPKQASLESTPPPSGEPPVKWDDYRTFIAGACDVIKVLEGDLRDAEQALRTNPKYQDLVTRIADLERELKASEPTAKDLLAKYEGAKKKLAEAQAQAEKARSGQPTADAKTELDQAQAQVTDAIKLIQEVVDASKGPGVGELLPVQIKTDLLETVLSNARALGGDPKAPAGQSTAQILTVLRKYPDVAGRLKAADTPPLNVLLLELAIQRLQYRRLAADRAAKKDVLAILKAQREVEADAAAAWIRVMDGLIAVGGTPASKALLSKQKTLVEVFDAAQPAQRQQIAEVLVAYGFAKLSVEGRQNALSAQLRDRYRAQSLDTTEVAVEAWNDLIRAPLAEITAYHEGGITAEDIARLIHAIGIAAIAIGVN